MASRSSPKPGPSVPTWPSFSPPPTPRPRSSRKRGRWASAPSSSSRSARPSCGRRWRRRWRRRSERSGMPTVGGMIVTMPTPAQAVNSVFRGIQWGLDRMVSVGYGVMYDYIVARFRPYQELHGEVLQLVEGAVAPGTNRREIRVLAAAGFETVGIDAYAGLVELAREKRKAHHLANLAFRHADLTRGGTFPEASFDQVVNIHSLYVQPDPQHLLREVHRVLKPGGRAVFVNFTRRVWLRSTVREVKRRDGMGAA